MKEPRSESYNPSLPAAARPSLATGNEYRLADIKRACEKLGIDPAELLRDAARAVGMAHSEQAQNYDAIVISCALVRASAILSERERHNSVVSALKPFASAWFPENPARSWGGVSPDDYQKASEAIADLSKDRGCDPPQAETEEITKG